MLVITWTQLLYISLVLILFYIAEVLFFLYKQKKYISKIAAEPSSVELESLKKELEMIKVRISALSASFSADSNLDSPRTFSISDTPIETESAYSQAIRLAKIGSDASELASTCGISRGEADLIVAIYRSNSERS